MQSAMLQARELGLTVLSIRQSKHFCLRLVGSTGREATWTFAKTSSDKFRAVRNNRAILKRIARQLNA